MTNSTTRALAAIGAAAVLVAGCGSDDEKQGEGEGAGPTATTTAAAAQTARYRDEVFKAVDVTRGVQYGRAAGADGAPAPLLLDLYKPRGDETKGRPAVVWIHGGGFTANDRTDKAVTVLADGFAKLGYVTASIDYRLLAGKDCLQPPFPSSACDVGAGAAQHDAKAAVRWLRAHAGEHGVDPSRIAVGGYSAGATTALNVGTRKGDEGESGTPGVSSDVKAVVSVSGALRDTSAVTPGDPAVAFFNGTSDRTVPYPSAAQTASAFLRAGIDVEWTPLHGVAHDSTAKAFRPILQGSSQFLYRKLALEKVGG